MPGPVPSTSQPYIPRLSENPVRTGYCHPRVPSAGPRAWHKPIAVTGGYDPVVRCLFNSPTARLTSAQPFSAKMPQSALKHTFSHDHPRHNKVVTTRGHVPKCPHPQRDQEVPFAPQRRAAPVRPDAGEGRIPRGMPKHARARTSLPKGRTSGSGRFLFARRRTLSWRGSPAPATRLPT